jgi:hypothetical protein
MSMWFVHYFVYKMIFYVLWYFFPSLDSLVFFIFNIKKIENIFGAQGL